MFKWGLLVHNELLKIVKRKGFLVPLLLLFVPVLILGNWDYIEYQQALQTGDWKENMKLDIARKQEELRAFGQADSPTADILRQEIAVGEYQLAHNISPYSEHSVFGFMNSAVALTSIIGVLLIFYASSIVSKEYSMGTIHFLLVRSASRTSILWAKFAALAMLYVILSAVLMLYSFIQGVFLYGKIAFDSVVVTAVGNIAVTESMMMATIKAYMLDFLPMLLFAAIALCLSVLLRSSGPALITTLLLFLSKGALAQLLSKYEWSKYVFVMHTNLRMNIEGLGGLTDTIFSIAVLLFYTSLFFLVAFFVFQKRDIA